MSRCYPQDPFVILNHPVNGIRGTVLRGEGMNLSIFQQIHLGLVVANPQPSVGNSFDTEYVIPSVLPCRELTSQRCLNRFETNPVKS